MLRASSHGYQGTSIMTHRQLLASLLLVATVAPVQAAVTDASLDAATVKEIGAWLNQHAGTARKVRRDPTPPPEDRISRATWFVDEHRQVPAPTWKLPAVKSAANCAACHIHVDEGDFSERNIRIPR